MARLPRLALAGELHHVVLRAHPGRPLLAEAEDRDALVRILRETLPTSDVAVHAYAVLPGEVHLLLTPDRRESVGRLMQSLGRRFGAWFNQRHGRQGALWDGRYRASVLEAERYLMAATALLETLPAKRAMVVHPASWVWSSAMHHLGLAREALITEHPLYWSLGNTPFERERAHALLLEQGVAEQVAEELHQAALRCHAIGGNEFIGRVRLATDLPLGPRPRGRPPKIRVT